MNRKLDNLLTLEKITQSARKDIDRAEKNE